MAETKRTNTQYVFPVNARFAQGFASITQGPTLARERVRYLLRIRPVSARFQAFSACQFQGMSSSMRLIL